MRLYFCISGMAAPIRLTSEMNESRSAAHLASETFLLCYYKQTHSEHRTHTDTQKETFTWTPLYSLIVQLGISEHLADFFRTVHISIVKSAHSAQMKNVCVPVNLPRTGFVCLRMHEFFMVVVVRLIHSFYTTQILYNSMGVQHMNWFARRSPICVCVCNKLGSPAVRSSISKL